MLGTRGPVNIKTIKTVILKFETVLTINSANSVDIHWCLKQAKQKHSIWILNSATRIKATPIWFLAQQILKSKSGGGGDFFNK